MLKILNCLFHMSMARDFYYLVLWREGLSLGCCEVFLRAHQFHKIQFQLACAIYLFAVTESGNLFNVFFLCVSLFILTLTMCSFKLRKSIHLLRCYLFFKLMLFTVLLIASLVLLFNKSAVQTWARKKYDEQMREHPEDAKKYEEYF